MAFINIDFKSAVLGMDMSVNVILPARKIKNKKSISKKYPVLWLLHGLSDDHSTWSRKTSIERYVEERELAVVMPTGHRSFYNDVQDGGPAYQKYISEELPEIMRSFFPLSGSREDNFIAGLSMGGYGAFRTAMAHPECYAAAASLSGAMDIVRRYSDKANPGIMQALHQVLGKSLSHTMRKEVDLFLLSRKLVKGKYKDMFFYQGCGTEDYLYDDNIRFCKHAIKIKLNHTYVEGPGGHEWRYWDEMIQKVIKWLPVKR